MCRSSSKPAFLAWLVRRLGPPPPPPRRYFSKSWNYDERSRVKGSPGVMPVTYRARMPQLRGNSVLRGISGVEFVHQTSTMH
jgi:hypothetical protein